MAWGPGGEVESSPRTPCTEINCFQLGHNTSTAHSDWPDCLERPMCPTITWVAFTVPDTYIATISPKKQRLAILRCGLRFLYRICALGVCGSHFNVTGKIGG